VLAASISRAVIALKKDFILMEQEGKLLLIITPEKELFSCTVSYIISSVLFTALKLCNF
jgi:hypothetical protein